MPGAVGIFDSGVGGLSVLREIRRELPFEDLIYAADSKYTPYGDQPAEFIERRAFAMVEFLVNQGAKAIVVACNTATGVAVGALRARWSLPIVAIEPAIKPAASVTKSGVVGVLATSQTIASPNFARLVGIVSGAATILPQPCPGLVEQVERGELNSASTRALVEQYVTPLLAKRADTLVLGCTHYPLIADLIRSVAGPAVTIVDPAQAVAKELRRRLEHERLLAPGPSTGSLRAWSTADPDRLRHTMTLAGFGDVEVGGV
jgi:glutamate racemase